jgi:pimeloyl-ACP methyl ester carboxylesterase
MTLNTLRIYIATALLCGFGLSFTVLGVSAQSTPGEDSREILTIDHYVPVRSTVTAIVGEQTLIYVRERTQARTVLRSRSLDSRVVLFVHGAGTPAEVAFDVPYEDYSWMAYLAKAGFDVFSMDMTGYGRSTRPSVMNDPCNLSTEQQLSLIPGLLSAPCAPSYPHQLTTIESDWNDLDAVVDYVRELRGVDRLSLIGWSLGGPRAGGYAAQHPEKVSRLVLLAPAYTSELESGPPETLPVEGPAMTKQSEEDFRTNWDRQVECPDQYDPSARDVVWAKMLESDPVGATWGPGVRRAPRTAVWVWNSEMAAGTETPTLLVAGIHDKQIVPERVRSLYDDLGSRRKVLVDLGCASHNAMWERNHTVLFEASLEWLLQETVEGKEEGVIRLGY